MLLIPMNTWNLSHLTSLKHLTLLILQLSLKRILQQGVYSLNLSTCVSGSKMCLHWLVGCHTLTILSLLWKLLDVLWDSLLLLIDNIGFFPRDLFFPWNFCSYHIYFPGKPISVLSFVNLIQPKYTQGIQYIHISNNWLERHYAFTRDKPLLKKKS